MGWEHTPLKVSFGMGEIVCERRDWMGTIGRAAWRKKSREYTLRRDGKQSRREQDAVSRDISWNNRVASTVIYMMGKYIHPVENGIGNGMGTHATCVSCAMGEIVCGRRDWMGTTGRAAAREKSREYTLRRDGRQSGREQDAVGRDGRRWEQRPRSWRGREVVGNKIRS